MPRPSDRRIRYWVFFVGLPPILAVAALILGRYTWQTATQYAELGEETIVESTLLLAREKIDSVEQFIISQDNAVFGLVDTSSPSSIELSWRPRAQELSPSVRALVVLDAGEEVQGFAIRGDDRERWSFLHLFRERIRPALELGAMAPWRLKHLHQTWNGRSYLISYKCIVVNDERFYLVAHHDTGYIVRAHLATLFASEEARGQYNVVDTETNRIVYGRSLAQAGGFLVGLQFPTTLYGWRLQVAPKQAYRLDQQGKRRRLTEAVIIGSSFVVILFGVISLLYTANKERQLNELKSEFIANVSHELKTPLSVVRMFGEMLLTRRVRSQEKQQQYLEIIVRESERLTGLIENVLDFAALERGKQRYELREGNVVEAVRKATETFRYRVEHEGLELAFHADEDVPKVALDENGIVLAVVNLLDNAVKYGGRSAIDVHVTKKERWVQIDVRDHGPGIPEEDKKRVFDRFFRTNRDTNTRGSGIGLALVKHIAEVHGGRAWASNAEGGGAVVSFSIPVGRRAWFEGRA